MAMAIHLLSTISRQLFSKLLPHLLMCLVFLLSLALIFILFFSVFHTPQPPLPPLLLWFSHHPISLFPSIYLLIFYLALWVSCFLCFGDDFVIWVCFVCRVLFENRVIGGDKRIFLGFGYVIGLRWWWD